MKRLTDQQVIDLMQGSSRLNKARREFSSACGRIDQASRQRRPLSPIDMRRMEFEAVEKIVNAYGEQNDELA